MAEIDALRIQEYSDNLILKSQQIMPKLAMYCEEEQASGKAYRMRSTVSKTDMVELTTSATPAMNVDIEHGGRWVYPRNLAWGKVVDDIDLLQTNINPTGAYVKSAVAASNRNDDDLFISAFFGTAKTDETGSTSTSFDSSNQIAAGAAGLTISKMRDALKILGDNDVDLDFEEVYMGVAPYQYDELLALTEVISTDFNLSEQQKPVLMEGKVVRFLGINIIRSTRLTVDSSDDRRIPVWVKSGMGKGIWSPLTGNIRTRPDLQGDPAYVEASKMVGYTRLDEDKCVEIKCVES